MASDTTGLDPRFAELMRRRHPARGRDEADADAIEAEKARLMAEKQHAITAARTGPYRDAKDKEPAASAAAATPGRQCPKCNRPITAVRNRCYACDPGLPKAGRVKPAEPAPLPKEPAPAGAAVPVVAAERHSAVAATPKTVAAGPVMTVSHLRQFAGALAGLNDDDARWAVETAYRESRSR